MGVEGTGGAALIGEHETPIEADLARPIQGTVGPVPGQAAGLGHAPQGPVETVGPAVEQARQRSGVARLVLEQQRPPMGASVGQYLDLAGPVSDHDDGVEAKPAGHVVADARDLRLVAYEDPTLGEDPVELSGEHVGVGVDQAVDPARLDQGFQVGHGAGCHRQSSRAGERDERQSKRPNLGGAIRNLQLARRGSGLSTRTGRAHRPILT